MSAQQRRALITGVNGQDGWYLARRLLADGYSVVGTTHRNGGPEGLDIDGNWVPMLVLDLSDMQQVEDLIGKVQPNEIYNFAARASSAQLFDDPLATADINGVAVARFLQAIFRSGAPIKFCQASSSEVFAGAPYSPQDESTGVAPRSAYGAAKAFGDHLVAAYRGSHGMFACSAVLYPHESRRRAPHFLVRKVARAVARIQAGAQQSVTLGDLEAVRDWGYAPDYVDAMRRMLQAPEARDYIVASGEAHSVREVCETAFGHVGLDWRLHVVVDESLVRPPERVPRVGNAARAHTDLGWRPTVGFHQMIAELVEFERSTLAFERSTNTSDNG
jgi:GDPmannose 4,6-dehydratase